MSLIVLITQERYPEGSAGAIRICNFANTLEKLGYRTLVIGLGLETRGICRFSDIAYISLRNKSKLITYAQFALRTLYIIKKLRKKREIKAVVLGTEFGDTLAVLRWYCNRTKIPLIKDVVEWYSGRQLSNGKLSFTYLSLNFENKYLINKKVRVIGISQYLYNYYRSKNIPSVRIPIYFNQDYFSGDKHTDPQHLSLLYAGNPGMKDLLSPVLQGIAMLSDDKLSKIRFTIIGIDEINLKKLSRLDEQTWNNIRNNLTISGRLPRKMILEHLKHSDFTVLLRPEHERYALAGFPTKVIESISAGTPVIMNLTSDMSMYFTNGVNCILSTGYDACSFRVALERALALSCIERENMCKNARNLAIEQFGSLSYAAQWQEIIN